MELAIFTKEDYIDRDLDHKYFRGPWKKSAYANRTDLFRALRRRLGRCVGKFFSNTPGCKAQVAGWVFEKVVAYRNAFSLPPNERFYKRECWVELFEADEAEITPFVSDPDAPVSGRTFH